LLAVCKVLRVTPTKLQQKKQIPFMNQILSSLVAFVCHRRSRQRDIKRRISIALLTIAAVASNLPAGQVVNVDQNGVALQGYDPVAYFTDGQPVKGAKELAARYNDATYYFASAEHKAQFEKEPGKYAPSFGGFCAFAVSRGATAPTSVDAFQIINGHLVLQNNKDVLKRWQEDPNGNFAKAEANWREIVQQNADKK
jgi:YHS domain-containing protein